MDSILTSIKKMLGIAEDDEHFDADLIVHINSVFMILNQLGVGPESYFSISDKTTTWDDFFSDAEASLYSHTYIKKYRLNETSNLELVKSYMYLKVRMLFDPPQSSAAIESANRQINEFEWRLNVAVDPGEEEEG